MPPAPHLREPSQVAAEIPALERPHFLATDGDRRDVPRIFSEATKTKAWLAKADGDRRDVFRVFLTPSR